MFRSSCFVIFVALASAASAASQPLAPLRPCHFNGKPADDLLHCDSSPHQILYVPASSKQLYGEQKKNLIVIDIDQTILDAQSGFHGVIPTEHAYNENGYAFKPLWDKDLVLMLLKQPRDYTLVFRKFFFDFLHYVHTYPGFSADLVIYTRARYDYAASVVMGINEFYKTHYSANPDPYNNMGDSLFKMVISTATPNTAKTISTLKRQVTLEKYKNIIILDDAANDVWCKHDMIRLKLSHNVNIALIQVKPFAIWDSVYRRFNALPVSMHYDVGAPMRFYDMIATNQQLDELFVRFFIFLKRLEFNDDIYSVLRTCASVVPGVPGNRLDDILWNWI